METTELVSELVYEQGCKATVVFKGPAGCPVMDIHEDGDGESVRASKERGEYLKVA